MVFTNSSQIIKKYWTNIVSNYKQNHKFKLFSKESYLVRDCKFHNEQTH